MIKREVFFIGERLSQQGEWARTPGYRGPGWYYWFSEPKRAPLTRKIGPFRSVADAVNHWPGCNLQLQGVHVALGSVNAEAR